MPESNASLRKKNEELKAHIDVLTARQYGIRGKLTEWLRDFLSDRWQRVVVNGSCSDWSNFSSGVPEGTFLGPVLFLLYINNLPTGISSEVRLFADDTVCCPDDHHRLQRDLHQLEQWATKWQMRFAPTKCFVLSVYPTESYPLSLMTKRLSPERICYARRPELAIA